MPNDETVAKLLLSYVSLLAERNAYGPGDGFEFNLWDAITGGDHASDLLSTDERDEIRHLVERTGQWITYDMETGMFGLMDLREWLELRAHE